METVSASDPADVIPAGVHIPVMLEEVVSFLRPCLRGDLLDGTLGGGGHAIAALEASAGGGRLLGLDRDQHALAVARQRLAPFASQCVFVHANFSQAHTPLFKNVRLVDTRREPFLNDHAVVFRIECVLDADGEL